MDPQINRWADALWDVCRIDEYYDLLSAFRLECWLQAALELRRDDGEEEQPTLERRDEEVDYPRQLELFADGEGQ